MKNGEPEFIAKYSESLRNHIAFTQEAGRQLGVSETQLLTHDQSKTDPVEWIAYAVQFHGGGSHNFAYAWLHHIHNNPHHWQHWMFPDGYHLKGNDMDGNIVRMPDQFVLEMVADWMGSSMAYTKSWDMAEWLDKNIPKIKLHSESWGFLRETLRNLGYTL